jgi:DNA-binding CsgD family transcriptional regulator
MPKNNWKNYERHPESAEYENISGKKWERFVNNLKTHGIVNRRTVKLWEGKVGDGWQLYRACLEADVEPAFEEVVLPKGMTFGEWIETVQDLRRHESQERQMQRAEHRRERVVAKRQEGKSTREIAKDEGVSQSTVQSDLRKSTEQGCSVEPPSGTVVGQDGKKRPAKRQPVKCERCTRLNLQVPDCPQCEEARQNKKKPTREPGDDSQAEKEEKQAKRSNGKAVFDDRKIEDAYGKLARLFNDRATAHGHQKHSGWTKVREHLNSLVTAWKAWQKER